MRVRVPPPASVHQLLTIADDLERRDALVTAEIERVDRLQAAVSEIRMDAGVAAGVLESAPKAIAANERLLVAAERERDDAAAALREADEDARPAAEAALAAAVAALERFEEHRAALTAMETDAQERAVRLAARAAALHEQLGHDDVRPPVPTLDGTLAWTSRARGALIVERSGFDRERESIVREASELLGSVLGDPLTSTSVAGLRDRLQRALT